MELISADKNIFTYAANSLCPQHASAKKFLDEQSNNKNFVICELVLLELYMNLRKPAIFEEPYSASEAVDYCEQLRSNPSWKFVDYDQQIRDKIWQFAAKTNCSYRKIIDARLAQTLLHFGVSEFATVNLKDFADFGFKKIWNPIL